ncbi:hypothetical protein CHRY9293_02695 [Chryseobacterium potabilaquae]|uniref:Uncharacterized protein n=1 Tax=Chryseobacterium potabilaquae TaxID=2675057 RepID=A0A6N4XDC5_9FLAO|nr:hypothetical protein CHRY9293_02695 [Chryseobacterium potabilaquae]
MIGSIKFNAFDDQAYVTRKELLKKLYYSQSTFSVK